MSVYGDLYFLLHKFGVQIICYKLKITTNCSATFISKESCLINVDTAKELYITWLCDHLTFC